jgi:membrane fusion protein (multidrug efflux system)
MNKTTKIILFVIIALFIAGMAFFPTIKKWLNKDEAPEMTSQRGSARGGRGMPLNVNVEILDPETLAEIILITGKIIPDEDVDLTFESSGKITGIFF